MNNRASSAALLGAALVAFLIVNCDDDTRPPPASQLATVTCKAQVQRCEAGPTLDRLCVRYGSPVPLTDATRGDSFRGGCVTNDQCAAATAGCEAAATRLCREPDCRLVPSTTSVALCATDTCGGAGPIGVSVGGGRRPSQGQEIVDDPSARFQLLSFAFTTATKTIDTNPPTRRIPLTAARGEPVAIEAAGFLVAATRSPDTMIGFDLHPDPPTVAIPPQPLQTAPNTFSLAEASGLLGNLVVADQVGVSLYFLNNAGFRRTKRVVCGQSIGLDADEAFGSSSTAFALTTSPASLCIAHLAEQLGERIPLTGDAVDLTVNSQDAWVVTSSAAGTGRIGRYANPTGLPLDERALDAEPLAIGGATMVGSTTPGAIVTLVKTARGGELRLFLGGDLGVPPRIVPFAGFETATPRAMKVLSIDRVEHAWVALQVGGKNVVALYNLATGERIAPLDVELNAFEPLALAAGILEEPPNNAINGSARAFLHVLVQSN